MIISQVFFEKRTAEAVSELNRDVRRSLRAVYRAIGAVRPDSALKSTTSFLDAWSEHETVRIFELLRS